MKIIIKTKVLIYVALLGVALIVVGVVLSYKVFPSFIETQIWKNTILKKDTRQWDVFMKIPFPLQVKVNFFNILNPDHVLQGAKPVVEEVGPYIYKFYRWKSDVEWDGDEISYYDWTRLEFDAEASGNLKEEDKVTILNSPYMAMILMVEEISEGALGTVYEALPQVFGNQNSLFVTSTVRDLLFDGTILCQNGGEGSFISRTICDQMKAKVKDAKPMEIIGNEIRYAYLKYKNNTHLGRLTVKSGQKIKEEVSNLVRYENNTYMSIWNGEKSVCNKIRGTTTFRPYISKNMTFEAFGEDICSILPMVYNSTETVKGIPGYRFIVPEDAFNTEKSSEHCFCINRSRDLDGELPGCLGNGVLDMTNCMSAPVVLSFPHLLHADNRYTKSVDGLTPNQTLHETFVILEPLTGAPLKMAKRVQFNMFIRAVQDITSIENVTNALVPILWVEESVTLPDDVIGILKSAFTNLKLLDIFKWFLIGFGGLTLGVSVALILYKL